MCIRDRSRCVDIVTGRDGAIPRCKPFKYTYEKEIVMYAYHKKLDYFSTECIYSPNAYRGHVRELIKDLEQIRPSAIVDIIHSGEQIDVNVSFKLPVKQNCQVCGYISSNKMCKACILLEGLNKGKAKLAIGKGKQIRQQLESLVKFHTLSSSAFPSDLSSSWSDFQSIN
eukprot:TRINITY_DN4457_c0_g1_i2.p1 TRINITY_DN4457_c0_g1~~TRINITY_DN4457_c0_g1_i2.p1  ORF type:complete len:170 (+),score=4.09 TRINITY_DN4457_c0_g1_i2:66-575(+)